nr:MAG TPA: Poxvirus P21 membrane protein [Caudoviricetes sp.]
MKNDLRLLLIYILFVLGYFIMTYPDAFITMLIVVCFVFIILSNDNNKLR